MFHLGAPALDILSPPSVYTSLHHPRPRLPSFAACRPLHLRGYRDIANSWVHALRYRADKAEGSEEAPSGSDPENVGVARGLLMVVTKFVLGPKNTTIISQKNSGEIQVLLDFYLSIYQQCHKPSQIALSYIDSRLENPTFARRLVKHASQKTNFS